LEIRKNRGNPKPIIKEEVIEGRKRSKHISEPETYFKSAYYYNNN